MLAMDVNEDGYCLDVRGALSSFVERRPEQARSYRITSYLQERVLTARSLAPASPPCPPSNGYINLIPGHLVICQGLRQGR